MGRGRFEIRGRLRSTLLMVWFVGSFARPAAAQSAPGVRVETREQRYELPDVTLTGIIERLNSTNLEGSETPLAQGLTQYDIQPDWRPTAAGGRCRASDVELLVRIVITLPTWPGAPGRPVSERTSWQTIESAIREHEYLHRDLTVEAAEALVDSLRRLETSGCRALRQVVAGEIALAGDRLREAHAELDRSTPKRLSVGG
jgi:predicted secreted Zn-dependent protease